MREIIEGVDLDDYIDEILDECDDSSIIEQVEKRDIAHKIDFFSVKHSPFVYMNKADAKTYICDLLEVGYFTDKDKLIEMLKDKI